MNSPNRSVVHGQQAKFKQLPAVDRLVHAPACAELVLRYGEALVTAQARALVADWRQAIAAEIQSAQANDEAMPEGEAAWAAALAERCQARMASRLRTVINLTGTVIHTNLGRAVLAPSALSAVERAMRAPNNLEYDLASGGRGDRDQLVEDLLCELTGAEAATVVNNNAAAVLLTLAALAPAREVIVSRGELVEIGGAFRMPDVMASAGAHMVEVGTTNRTHLRDYAQAINPQTSLLLKVHTSNYAIQGFTSSVSEAELAVLARERGVCLATDLGSGSLVDLTQWGLPPEPTPQAMLAAGCDVVTFSGDKLLGGPQAGLIVGRKDVIARIRKHPLKRALRVSKLPLAALEATLRLYLQPDRLQRELPTLRWLTRPTAEIRAVAERLAQAFRDVLPPPWVVQVVDLQSQIGSGSLPVDRLPSVGVALGGVGGGALNALGAALRALPEAVIGRIERDQLRLDCRCLDDVEVVRRQLGGLRVAGGK